MLRIMADENCPVNVIAELQRLGHDVVAAREVMPAAPDEVVLSKAELESRLIVTFDKGFGELAFRRGLADKCGIVLFRLSGHSRESDVRRAIEVMESRSDWPGSFTVATEAIVRIRTFKRTLDQGEST